MVFSLLPSSDMSELLSSEMELPLSASPMETSQYSPVDNLNHTERGNIDTFLDPSYSITDRAKLNALPYFLPFFRSQTLPYDPALTRWTKWLSKCLTFEQDTDTVWKLEQGLKLRVLINPADILAILRELHDGFGHHAMPAVYHHCKPRYKVPAAPKIIQRNVHGC